MEKTRRKIAREALRRDAQASADAQYLHGPGGLDNFYDQAEGWIQTQTMKRANSGDPKNYVPEPFRMAIPRRQFVVFDAEGIRRVLREARNKTARQILSDVFTAIETYRIDDDVTVLAIRQLDSHRAERTARTSEAQAVG